MRKFFSRFAPSLALLFMLLVVQVAMFSPRVLGAIGDMWALQNISGTDVLRVTSAGHVLPGADNTYDLGSAAASFRNATIDGTATVATLAATTFTATNLDGILGGVTPAAATVTTLTATGNVTMNDASADTLLFGAAADTVTITGDTSITDTQWSVSAAGVASFAGTTVTTLDATGNITANDAGADNILLGAAADTVTIISNTLSLTDDNWSITAAGLANFAALQGANQTFNTATSTDDQIRITPQAGGAARFTTNLTTADLTADRAVTFPDAAGTVTLLGNTSTGSGSVVLATSPTLVTPTLGAATATTINGNTFTTGTGTLTLGAAKTLTANNSLTLAGTDGTTMTFPATSGTVVTLAETQTLTNKTLTAPTIGGTTVASAGALIAHDNGAVSAVAGAATSNTQSAIVTSEALTTAAGSDYTLTFTNSKIAAGSNVLAVASRGTDTGGIPHVLTVTPGAGSVTIVVRNIHASAALNGTIKVWVLVAN